MNTCERSRYGCTGSAEWHVWHGPARTNLRYAGRLCGGCADLFDPHRHHSTPTALVVAS